MQESEVGGLELLKEYLMNRKKAFEPGNGHLPKPKALLLVGVPGCGKSLSCKAAASILGWPLIRLDLSALKGSLVGESERKMRQATATIDAFGKAVIWIDEAEKVLSGVKSSGVTDGGTTSSMLAHLLMWLQETRSPILVMATPMISRGFRLSLCVRADSMRSFSWISRTGASGKPSLIS